jgi:GntR family transcriptional regulator, carbon starvation induced regulator
MGSRANLLPQAPDIAEAGRNLAGGIATRLRTDIVSGAFRPDTKLSIDELRLRYGVSLSPLREALSRLAAEGFVVLEDKKGFRVAPVSRDNCLEVAQLQQLMEPYAITQAIAKGDAAWEEQIVAAYHSLSRLERSERKDGGGVDAWEHQHRRFHAALIAACGMPLLQTLCASLHDFAARYRRLFLASHPLDPGVAGEHEAIMRATLDRKPGEACRLLRVHVERTAQNILDALDDGADRA